MFDCPDHPIIQNLMRTGYPDGKEPKEFCCPICAADAEDFYRNPLRQIVGCEHCLTITKYWEIEVDEDGT